MTAPRVRVRDLAVHAGGAPLVSGVDLDLHAGRVVTLVGPSGAGKSTIAAAVAGVSAPHLTVSGSIEIAPGCRVAHLPQDAALTLNPARRVGTALGELAALHGDPPRGYRARKAWRARQVDDLLSRAAFPVDERHRRMWPRRFPFEFSGGQRTRLALAQVLAARPDVLVLDEPSTGLDTVSRRLLVDALADVRDRGMALLLVTHDDVVAHELGDDILGVRDGRIVPYPRPDDLSGGPRPSVPVGDAVLTVDAVTVRMPRSTVLQGVSLSARRSELVALVGPSGSGKTTLARAVTGLVPLSHGRITLDGRALPRLSRRPRATLADVQYVCQEVRASFEPDRPVVDQVLRTAVQLRGLSTAAARTEARAILRRLDIDGEQASRLPDALSGGQLRRVALARASIARPRVLLCDEVTTGLERPLAELILDEIDVLRREIGTAVVLIGHDLRALTGRADRLIVLGRGEVTDDLESGDWAHGSPGLHRLLAADGLSFEPAPSGEPAAVRSRS